MEVCLSGPGGQFVPKLPYVCGCVDIVIWVSNFG